MTDGRLRWVLWAAWIMLLLAIPVTSFPYFPIDVFRNVVVRPLAIYPLVILLCLDVVPAIVRGGRLPRIAVPLLVFAVIAAAITGLSLLNPPPVLRGISPGSRALRGIITLGIGVSFFLVAARTASGPDRTRRTFQWLYVGAGLALALGAVQAVRLLTGWPEYEAFNQFQRLISVRDLHINRVTGPSFEPSWFADYLSVLVLPLAVGGVLSRSPLVTGSQARRLLGAGFVLGAFVILLTTYSRGGLAAFVVSTLAMLAIGGRPYWNDFTDWLRARRDGDRSASKQFTRFAFVTLVIIAVAAVSVLLLVQNDYFALLWVRLGRVADLHQYMIAIGGGPRLALGQAAWEVYERFPWTGTGLGQSGFYIIDQIPNWAMGPESEINDLMIPTSWLFPNPKNLWLRLLSETGIVGTLTFVAFLLGIAASSLYLARLPDPLARHIGLAGVGGCAAYFLEGFSLDSFALPAAWILFGIVAAGVRSYAPVADRHERDRSDSVSRPAIAGESASPIAS